MHVRLLTTVLCFTTFSKIGLLPSPVLAGSMLARVLIHPPGPPFTLFHPFLPAPPCLILSGSLLLTAFCFTAQEHCSQTGTDSGGNKRRLTSVPCSSPCTYPPTHTRPHPSNGVVGSRYLARMGESHPPQK